MPLNNKIALSEPNRELCVQHLMATQHNNHFVQSIPVINRITSFYDWLSSVARHIPQHNFHIIGRDMNAQRGDHENNKFVWHNLQIKMANIQQIFPSRTVIQA